jgi:hypothetical protein
MQSNFIGATMFLASLGVLGAVKHVFKRRSSIHKSTIPIQSLERKSALICIDFPQPTEKICQRLVNDEVFSKVIDSEFCINKKYIDCSSFKSTACE